VWCWAVVAVGEGGGVVVGRVCRSSLLVMGRHRRRWWGVVTGRRCMQVMGDGGSSSPLVSSDDGPSSSFGCHVTVGDEAPESVSEEEREGGH
jgi:hypothetical protein